MHRHVRYLAPLVFAVASVSVADSAMSAVILNSTRVIFPGQDREVSVRLKNDGETASLVQAWIDDGDADATPSTAKAPFILRPPIFRVDGGREQVVRILFAGESLPQDRESLFWFNAREVPASAASEAHHDRVHVLVRTRVKLFYRPKGLSAGLATKAPTLLKWELVNDGDGPSLRTFNPTPFHVNLNRIDVGNGQLKLDTGVVAPLSSERYALTSQQYHALGSELSIEYVNDQGGAMKLKVPLVRP